MHTRNGSTDRSARILLVGLVASVALTQTGRASARTGTEQDRWGRDTRTENGEPISHPRPADGGILASAARAGAAATAPGASRPVAPPALGSSSITGSLGWHFETFGVGIGDAGLFARDLDGDGTVEIVAAAGPLYFWPDDRWYVVSRKSTGFGQLWVSPTYAQPITALLVADVDADPALEVLVATGGQLLVYDGATHALERTITGMPTEMRSPVITDVDRDGAAEIVSTDGTDLFVHDFATGALEYRGVGLGGSALAVGDVNGNRSPEIVVTNDGGPGRVIGGRNHRLIWTQPDGFGSYVAIADVDRDGRNDIVGASSWYTGIAVYDAVGRVQKGGVTVFNIDALTVMDVDGDGWPEVLYGDAQWGSVHVLEGNSLTQRWAFENPMHGVTRIAWGDVDGDGVGELLFGAGYSSTGPDYLYIVDGASHTLDWRSTDLVGPFEVATGDADGDGRPEIVSGSASSDSGYADGLWFVHDAGTHALEFASGPTTGQDWMGLSRIRLANVDADPQAEIIVASSRLYQGAISCYDGLTHVRQWQTLITDGLAIASMAVADVDGGGTLEVVAGTRQVHSGAPGTFVFVLDAATGALKWQSFTLGSGRNWSLLRVANLGGATPRIIAGQTSSGGGRLAVLDAAAHTVSLVATPPLSALEVMDGDGNGISEILAGLQDGRLVRLDPQTGVVEGVIANYQQAIDGLVARDLDGDGVADYTFALAGTVYIASGVDGHALWSSGAIGAIGGDHIAVSAPAPQGRFRLAVGTGSTGFMVFKLRRGGATLAASPE